MVQEESLPIDNKEYLNSLRHEQHKKYGSATSSDYQRHSKARSRIDKLLEDIRE